MPIPLIIAGIVGAIGISEHMSAKETNEKAQKLNQSAQDLYDDSKRSFEKAKHNMEQAYDVLGRSKIAALQDLKQRFLPAFNKVKDMELSKSTASDKLSEFSLDEQDAIEISKMVDIYESSLSSGVVGAATGTIIALAASGSLSIVTGAMSSAAVALSAGSIEAAAGIASSALSFGAAMTPLSAIAAPVLLFTGISSSIKADENLEKARAMYAKAELAVEEMKILELKCDAVSERAHMLNDLLKQLTPLLFKCTDLLVAMVESKTECLENKKISSQMLTQEETNLLSVALSLAGAVKSIIDTPLLGDNGEVSQESESLYNNVTQIVPTYEKDVEVLNAYNYDFKKPEAKQIQDNTDGKAETAQKSEAPTMKRNVFAFLFAAVVAIIGGAVTDSSVVGWIIFSISMLLMMKTKEGGFSGFIQKALQYLLIVEGAAVIYYYATDLASMEHSAIKLIIATAVGAVIFCMTGAAKKRGKLCRLLQRIMSIVVVGSISLLLFKLLFGLFGIPPKPAAIACEIIFLLFALFAELIVQQGFDNPNS